MLGCKQDLLLVSEIEVVQVQDKCLESIIRSQDVGHIVCHNFLAASMDAAEADKRSSFVRLLPHEATNDEFHATA